MPMATHDPARAPSTVEELAKLLRVHKQTVLAGIRRGEITATRVGRQYRIPATEVDRLTGEQS